MNWIVAKRNVSDKITKLEIKAPEIAFKWKPGCHVYVKIEKHSERIPLIVLKANVLAGTVTVFILKKGVGFLKLANLVVGDEIESIEGPFGEPVTIKKVGTVICAAGGVGISPLFPIVNAMKAAGNKVITIIGARTKEFLFLSDELKNISDELIILTDDGSMGSKGLVPKGIMDVLKREHIDQVITFGSAQMIKHSTLITCRFNTPLIATLYSMRIDGIGINAAYRVAVCGGSRYICVNGDDFNAYYTDFDEMIERMENRLKEEYIGNQNYIGELIQ